MIYSKTCLRTLRLKTNTQKVSFCEVAGQPGRKPFPASSGISEIEYPERPQTALSMGLLGLAKDPYQKALTDAQ